MRHVYLPFPSDLWHYFLVLVTLINTTIHWKIIFGTFIAYTIFALAVHRFVPSRWRNPPSAQQRLRPIYTCLAKDNDEQIAHIVFVHGLGSNPDTTWYAQLPSRKVDWIHEYLAPDLCAAISNQSLKLWQYNYNSIWIREASHYNLSEHGQDLIRGLQELKGKIILVGHSYGGLVIKQALVHSTNEQYRDTREAIQGIIYLGTPHRGTTFTTYGSIISNILANFGARSEMLLPLRFDSEQLHALNDDFQELQLNIPMAYCYEKQPARFYLFGFFPLYEQMIVNEASATWGARRTEKYPFDANHSGLNKFKERNADYLTLLRILISMLKPHIVSPYTISPLQARICNKLELTSAAFPLKYTPALHQRTCAWLVQNEIYTSWLAEDNFDTLWLTGPPGCGKSTLAEYLRQEIPASRPHTTVLFFKFDSQFESRSEILAVMTCLLLQLILLHPKPMDDILMKIGRQDQSQVVTSLDSFENCCAMFESLVSKIKESSNLKTLTILIDALDEYQLSYSDDPLLSYLSGLMTAKTGLAIKLLITVRDSAVTEFGLFKQYPKLDNVSIPVALNNKDAIALSVNTQLKLLPKDTLQDNELETLILQRADGNFLWVSLVIKDLLSSGTMRHHQLQLIKSLPHSSDLKFLYTKALSRIPEHSKLEARNLFLLCTSSLRCLRVEELADAMTVSESSSFEDLQRKRPGGQTDDLTPALERSLATLGRGLLLLQDGLIRPVHSTVSQYLAECSSEHQLGSLDPKEKHGIMANICMVYLRLLDTSRAPDPAASIANMPFLQYAASYFLLHAERAPHGHIQGLVSQIDRLFSDKDFFAHWKYLVRYHGEIIGIRLNAFEMMSTEILFNPRRMPNTYIDSDPNILPAHLLSYLLTKNLLLYKLVLQRFLNDSDCSVLVDRNQRNPLHWAAAKRSLGRIPGSIYVMMKPQPVDFFGGLLRITSDVNATTRMGLTALHYAVLGDNCRYVAMLINAGANLNARTATGQTPLHYAICSGATGFPVWPEETEHLTVAVDSDPILTMVQTLLRLGANPRITNLKGHTVFHAACRYGVLSVVTHLMSKDADIDSPDFSGSTPLMLAALHRHQNVVEALLKASADPTFGHGIKSATPLSFAARHGATDIVRILLERGANTNATVRGLSPLYEAIEADDEESVRLLISHKADVNALLEIPNPGARGPDHFRTTALHLACQVGSIRIVDLLIDAGAKVNIPGHQGATPLHLACSNGHTEIMRKLLARGATVDSETMSPHSPSSLAFASGHTETANLLIA